MKKTHGSKNLVQRARSLAEEAHAGQIDKAGRPYIEHVARVAAAVAADPDAEALAWLHDVVEDCPAPYPALAIDLMNEAALFVEMMAIIFRPGTTKAAYYARIRELPTALCVKLADVADNANESRLALLDDKTATRLRRKYARAMAALADTLDASTAAAGRLAANGAAVMGRPGAERGAGKTHDGQAGRSKQPLVPRT